MATNEKKNFFWPHFKTRRNFFTDECCKCKKLHACIAVYKGGSVLKRRFFFSIFLPDKGKFRWRMHKFAFFSRENFLKKSVFPRVKVSFFKKFRWRMHDFFESSGAECITSTLFQPFFAFASWDFFEKIKKFCLIAPELFNFHGKNRKGESKNSLAFSSFFCQKSKKRWES